MQPNAPAANPTTSNTNQPFGGFGQAQTDYSTASNILNYLPTQEAGTVAAANNANTNTGSILPNINVNAPTFTAPTAPTINAGNYGTNLAGYNQAVQGAESGLTSAENSTFGQAVGALQGAEQKYGNLTPVYQQLAGEYNIPGYQNDVATLSGLLQNLNRDVNAQTTLGGGLMTESARDETYQNEAQPLQTALNNSGEFLQFSQNDVSNLLDTYEKSLTNALNPLQTDISALPTLFGQTNEAAEAGYNQGANAIQQTIQQQQFAQTKAIQEEQAASEAEQASAAMKQANVLAGQGESPVLGGTASTPKTGAATYGLKVANNPASGYYFENANGQPINAIQYAQATGVPPIQVVNAMASSGDGGAKQLIGEVQQAQKLTGIDPNSYLTQYYGSF